MKNFFIKTLLLFYVFINILPILPAQAAKEYHIKLNFTDKDNYIINQELANLQQKEKFDIITNISWKGTDDSGSQISSAKIESTGVTLNINDAQLKDLLAARGDGIIEYAIGAHDITGFFKINICLKSTQINFSGNSNFPNVPVCGPTTTSKYLDWRNITDIQYPKGSNNYFDNNNTTTFNVDITNNNTYQPLENNKSKLIINFDQSKFEKDYNENSNLFKYANKVSSCQQFLTNKNIDENTAECKIHFEVYKGKLEQPENDKKIIPDGDGIHNNLRNIFGGPLTFNPLFGTFSNITSDTPITIFAIDNQNNIVPPVIEDILSPKSTTNITWNTTSNKTTVINKSSEIITSCHFKDSAEIANCTLTVQKGNENAKRENIQKNQNPSKDILTIPITKDETIKLCFEKANPYVLDNGKTLTLKPPSTLCYTYIFKSGTTTETTKYMIVKEGTASTPATILHANPIFKLFPEGDAKESTMDDSGNTTSGATTIEEHQSDGNITTNPGSGQVSFWTTANPKPVDAQAPFFGDAKTYTSLADYLTDFYTYAIWLVTAISIVMIIFGGYTIITSQGNPEGVTKGRGIVVSALTSLAIIVLAYVILRIISPSITSNEWVELPPMGVTITPTDNSASTGTISTEDINEANSTQSIINNQINNETGSLNNIYPENKPPVLFDANDIPNIG